MVTYIPDRSGSASGMAITESFRPGERNLPLWALDTSGLAWLVLVGISGASLAGMQYLILTLVTDRGRLSDN